MNWFWWVLIGMFVLKITYLMFEIGKPPDHKWFSKPLPASYIIGTVLNIFFIVEILIRQGAI